MSLWATADRTATAETNRKVTMNALPDGVSYPGAVVLGIPKSKIEVRITKSNYQKLAQ